MTQSVNQFDKAIILMTRVPKAGQTKTRLMPALTGEECVAFHNACLKDLVRTLNKIEVTIYVFYTGELTEGFVRLFPKAVRFFPQKGADLGERMAEAFKEIFKTHRSVLMIGSDIPNLDKLDFEKAFAILDLGQETNLVLGPALDGGYYLIGMKRLYPDLFEGICWGGSQVLAQTLQRAEEQGVSYQLLRKLRDIDTFADLCEYGKDERNSQDHAYQVSCKVLARFSANREEVSS